MKSHSKTTKRIKLPTADELQACLADIQPDPYRRGWKTAFLDQHQASILAALEHHTYAQVAKAIRAAGVPVAEATLANWAKRHRSDLKKSSLSRPIAPRSGPASKARREQTDTPLFSGLEVSLGPEGNQV